MDCCCNCCLNSCSSGTVCVCLPLLLIEIPSIQFNKTFRVSFTKFQLLFALAFALTLTGHMSNSLHSCSNVLKLHRPKILYGAQDFWFRVDMIQNMLRSSACNRGTKSHLVVLELEVKIQILISRAYVTDYFAIVTRLVAIS